MASLTKNGKNFGLRWFDADRTPSQVRESLKTESKSRALQKKSELEWKYLNGKHDPWSKKWYETTEKSELVSVLIEQFISYKITVKGQKAWSESVAQRETYVLRKFARMVGGAKIHELNEQHLQDFYYRDSVTSDHTRQGDYISINTFLNWCIENKIINEKPQFRPAKPQTKVPKFITVEQLKTLIDYRVDKIKADLSYNVTNESTGAYWVPLSWMILAGTGLRPVELANLKTTSVYSDHLLIGEDFTTKVRSERRVPLLFESKQATHLLTSPQFRSKEANLSASPYLLGRKPSYSKKQLSYEFTETWNACFPNQPKRTLYNLKDTFAVRFLSDDSGMKLNELKEILGHSSLDTTMRYLKAVPYGTKIKGTIFS